MPGIFIGNTLIKNRLQNWSSYWTPLNKAAKAPTLLNIVYVTDTDASLSWTNNGIPNYTGHKIYISTDNITFTLKSTINSIGTSYLLTGLTRGTLYYFYVVAYKGAGESNHSNTVSDTMLAWYDDFESNNNAYFAVANEAVVINQIAAWNPNGTHTASVVEANLGGFKYWMWWTAPEFEGIGLARSNSLTSGWEQYVGNPVLPSMRWVNAYMEDGIIYLFYDIDPSTNSTYIGMRTTTDGITLSDQTVIVPAETGFNNTGSFLFKNPNDNLYYFYYSRLDVPVKTIRQILCRVSTTISGIASAAPVLVMDQTSINVLTQYWIQFSIIYKNGKYWMALETSEDWQAGSDWVIFTMFSDNPLSGFQISSDSPILYDDRACPTQHVFNNQLYLYISYRINAPDWDTRVLTSNFSKNTGVQWRKVLGNAGSSIAYSTEQKINGTKSIKLVSGTGGSSNTTIIKKYFRASYNTVKFGIYITSITEAGSYTGIADIKLAGIRKVAFGYIRASSLNWRYNDGTTWANSTIAVTVGWHEFEIIFGAEGVTVKVDGSTMIADLGTQTQWDEIDIDATNSITANKYTTIYVDDFKVIKV